MERGTREEADPLNSGLLLCGPWGYDALLVSCQYCPTLLLSILADLLPLARIGTGPGQRQMVVLEQYGYKRVEQDWSKVLGQTIALAPSPQSADFLHHGK